MDRPTDHIITWSQAGIEVTLACMREDKSVNRSDLSDLMQYYRAVNRMAVHARDLEERYAKNLGMNVRRPKSRSSEGGQTQAGIPNPGRIKSLANSVTQTSSAIQSSLDSGVFYIDLGFGQNSYSNFQPSSSEQGSS